MHVKEATNGISRSYTIEHHKILEAQGVGNNLRIEAILATCSLHTVKKAGLQLVNLEGVVLDLQRVSAILAHE